MLNDDLLAKADLLTQNINNYLISVMGSSARESSNQEFYRAFSYALREGIMVNWAARLDTKTSSDARTIYYLSMEYLPGRILGNNITNLQADDLIKVVMKKTNRNLNDIITCESDPGLGNGGLGRLASCFLDSLATLKYPARGYGLRYQYGIFEQNINRGHQVERPDCWLISENPWEFRRDSRAVTIKFRGNMVKSTNCHEEPSYDLNSFEKVWAIPYDIPIVGYSLNDDHPVLTLRLWTTRESPHNFQLQRYNAGRLGEAAENTNITHVLYPNDSHETGMRMRLKQEYLLVAASLQDIISDYQEQHGNDFSQFIDKVCIQINDTHPALIVAELMRMLTHTYELPWNKAWEITQNCICYTNHTVLKEALEEWPRHLFCSLLPRQHEIIERINLQLCTEVRQTFKGSEDKVRNMSILENDRVRMANLAIYGSRKINGVAKLHSKILKKSLFKDFHDCYPDKFTNVTNGITQRRWLLHCNPELANFISRRIGDDWITDFSQIKKLAIFADDEQSQEEFLHIKQNNKRKLFEYLAQKHESSYKRPKRGHKHMPPMPTDLDSNALCDVHIKRFHEYKRQLLNILHVLMLYYDILDSSQLDRVKRTVIFSGKAAPGYTTAKNIILLIHCVARLVNTNPIVNKLLKVVFIENYNVSNAQLIIPAADLSEQISTAGMEASGTGNMKLTINGALTIGTEDGANIEMREEVSDEWWPFSFGCSAEEIETMITKGSYSPWQIYNNNPKIKKVIDTLSSGALSNNTEEQQAFNNIHQSLLEPQSGNFADRYFVIKDLEDYYNTQKLVESLYRNKSSWATYAIHNIAGMGKFSSDRSIQNYANNIWNIDPMSIQPHIANKMRQEYEEHNKYEMLRRGLNKVQAFIMSVEEF